jgi:peptidoglycan/LPS O-acetylase OafA/YrhL
MPTPLNKPKERFVFIDGLRGMAALGVMLHHLYTSELHAPLSVILPRPVLWIIGPDIQRVQVFFVISGFVIAWSLRNMVVNAGSAANFILRRQVRLDPLYWLMVAVTMVHLVIINGIPNTIYHPGVPGPGGVLINLLYLQNVTRSRAIVPDAWTLCLEIQLYLVYILLLLLIQRLITWRKLPPSRRGMAHLAVILPPLFLSVWLHDRHWAWPWFILSWYLFAMGVLVCWAMEGRISWLALAVICLLEMAFALRHRDQPTFWCVGVATAISIAFRVGGLTTWLKQGFFQYFGRISYSLFLVHWEVGKTILHFGAVRSGMAHGPAVGWFVLAIAASIGVAHVMNVLVERPTIALSARLKQRPAAPVAVALAPAGVP